VAGTCTFSYNADAVSRHSDTGHARATIGAAISYYTIAVVSANSPNAIAAASATSSADAVTTGRCTANGI
jgi:hypothetical protein